MPILVFVESAEGKIKKTSMEAVAYAHAMGDLSLQLRWAMLKKQNWKALGKYGAQKVLHASDEKLNKGIIQVYAAVISKALAGRTCRYTCIGKFFARNSGCCACSRQGWC